MTEPIRRLLAFHAPENFAASWLQGILEAQNLPPAQLRTWNWVLESLAS